MKASKLLTLGILSGGSADPSASFTVTTTGAQTLTISWLVVSASTTVDWGDGTSDAYTGSGARTHNYAGAGTWTMRFLQPLNVTAINFQDTKITALSGAQIAKFINLTSCQILTLPVTWTVGADAPMPTGLTYLQLYNLTNFIWTVSPAVPIPVNMSTLQLVNLPNLSPVSTGLETLTKLATLQYENNLTTAQVNATLASLWAGFAARTVANGTIDLLGTGNQGPTGPVSAQNPPTYGGAYAYELVNDTGNANPTKKWTSVTTATPV